MSNQKESKEIKGTIINKVATEKTILTEAQQKKLDEINSLNLQKESSTHGERIYKANYDEMTDRQKSKFRRKLRTKFADLRHKLFVELKQKQKVSDETKKEIQNFFSENFTNDKPTKIEQISMARTESKQKDIVNFLETCQLFEIFN